MPPAAYHPSNFFFTDLDDAKKKAKEIGDEARIFAIQYNGKENSTKEDDKNYPSRVVPILHPGGNHATFHQSLKNGGFWEWLGPDKLDSEDFMFSASSHFVKHEVKLPAYNNTIYGVAVVPEHDLRPPAEANLAPQPAPVKPLKPGEPQQ